MSNGTVARATPLATILDAAGQGDQPAYVELSDRLTVGVRLQSMEALIALGLIPDPLIAAAAGLGKQAERGGALPPNEVRDSIELQDCVCAAIIVDPPYASLAEVREQYSGQPPRDKLSLGVLRNDEIMACFTLIYRGLDHWATFRAERQRAQSLAAQPATGDAPERAGNGDADTAPGDALGDAPALAAPSTVDAGSGAGPALAGSAAGGPGAASGPSGGARNGTV